MILPSKELLSEVLGKEIEIRGFKDEFIPSNFEYIEDFCNVKVINIYELAHLCKEWAFSEKYFIVSGFILFGQNISIVSFDLKGEIHRCKDDSEFEAVVQACEWVLKEKQCGEK